MLLHGSSGAHGPARASRTKSRGADRDDFVQADKSLCFDLDASPLSLRSVKAQALRGNKNIYLPAPAGRRALRPPPPITFVLAVLHQISEAWIILGYVPGLAARNVVSRMPRRTASHLSLFSQSVRSATATWHIFFPTALAVESLRGRNANLFARLV